MSFNYAVSDVSDKIIGEAIAQASSAAKTSIESLLFCFLKIRGMTSLAL